MKHFFKDIKNIVILTLTILFLIKIPQENIRFVYWVLSSVVFSALVDLTIHYYSKRRFFIPKSAIISGYIVAGILSYHEPFWFILTFSSIAILSKHLIVIHKKHFLNPANAALTVATLFNIPLIWSYSSNINTAIVSIAGFYFVYRLKKWGHLISFIIIASIFLFFREMNPLWMLNWFFIFIMLIEPKTSGNGYMRGAMFGAIAAIASMLLFIWMPQYDFYVLGLFVANLFNPVIDKFVKQSTY